MLSKSTIYTHKSVARALQEIRENDRDPHDLHDLIETIEIARKIHRGIEGWFVKYFASKDRQFFFDLATAVQMGSEVVTLSHASVTEVRRFESTMRMGTPRVPFSCRFAFYGRGNTLIKAYVLSVQGGMRHFRREQKK